MHLICATAGCFFLKITSDIIMGERLVKKMEAKDILLAIRKKHNLTQDAMAEKLLVTRQAVSRWETGETVPNIDTAQNYIEVFRRIHQYAFGAASQRRLSGLRNAAE